MTTELIDPFQRKIEYLRLSVTDRCDLRCFYCMPKKFDSYQEPENWLTFDEIERVVRAFSELGVRHIRLTGGEPLIRKNLPDLVQRISNLEGVQDLSLSTNCVSMRKYAQDLKQAGLNRINVSLDTLNPQQFMEITSGKLEKVLDGLMAAKEAGFHPIKVNMVALRGINDAELGDMVDFCLQHNFTLRFIETMPVGATGSDSKEKYYLDLDTVYDILAKRFELIPSEMEGAGPAKYHQIKGTDFRFGFITPISQHFCETCNRVRISTDGTLYLCLGKDDKVELRTLLRDGISDDGLKNAILEAVKNKPEKHEFKDNIRVENRFMNMTGG